MKLFHWALLTRYSGKKPEGLFPAAGSFTTRTPDVILDLLLLPGGRYGTEIALKIRRLIHHGDVGLYLLYLAMVLCTLLAASILVR
ncbi:MAG TPA: hypothetical protein ENN06_05530 [Desulfobacteraceae bacterium]|nr:hypothetical protein [Desulfobacteraceae bacterium]